MTSLAKSDTGLYWSIRGAVLCADHVRDIDADKWQSDGWSPLPESSQGPERRYQCQRCSRDGTALASRRLFGP
jgi:hypothetical protein